MHQCWACFCCFMAQSPVLSSAHSFGICATYCKTAHEILSSIQQQHLCIFMSYRISMYLRRMHITPVLICHKQSVRYSYSSYNDQLFSWIQLIGLFVFIQFSSFIVRFVWLWLRYNRLDHSLINCCIIISKWSLSSHHRFTHTHTHKHCCHQ